MINAIQSIASKDSSGAAKAAGSGGAFQGIVDGLRHEGTTYESALTQGNKGDKGEDFLTLLAELETNMAIATRLTQELLTMANQITSIHVG